MTRLVFYLRYAARNLRRNTRWTAFAVFSIAAGVATVVALRSLGLAIGDSLVDNARASNHGDLTVSYAPPANAAFAFFGRGGEEMQTFSPGEIEAYSAWAAEQNAQITFYSRAFGLQVTPVDAVTVGRPQLVSALLIDPATFPPTGDINATEPAGVPLSDLFPTTTSIVISQNLAEQQGVGVGDVVRVSNTTQEYTVTGIVPTETEAGTRDFFAAFFGFAYLHISQAETLQLDSAPNVASMVFPAGSDSEAMENAFIDAMRDARQPLFNLDLINVSEIMAQNETIGDYIGRFIVVMGLGALLIGGVGIINTMLVMVGRRTNEIAALKTFGLKGRQVSSLFFAEAFLLGLMGSAVGSLIGVLLSGAVNRYGEAFLQQRLVWRFYPEAVVYGLGLGMVVTLVFGILPILTANRIRPAIILRPNETHVAGVGVLHALIALLVVVIVIGLVAGQILGVPLIGVIGVALTLLILGVLVGLLWVIVWLVGKLPSFGSVDLRLALRNLSSRRIRTATTLLALSAGMFALSSITFVGVGTREILQFQLTQQFGGNVLVFPLVNLISSAVGQTVVQNIADQYPGTYNTRLAQFTVEIVSIDGQAVEVAIPFNEDAPRGMQRAFRSMPVQMRSSDNPNLSSGTLLAGRDLTPADVGQPVIVLPQSLGFGIEANVQVGSELVVRLRGTEYTFTVVGIVADTGGLATVGQGFIPWNGINTFSGFQFNVLNVPDADLNSVLLSLSEIPFVFALDITFIDGLLKRLIDMFSALPTLVGLLSLMAAAVSMANTVSLATLERRRQIGILKAVGLKGRRVLWVMLLENTLIGLLGGLIGIGVSALGVAIMTALGQGDAIPIPRDATPVAVALVVASVLIAWAATFLSGRVATRERVANVLRYE